MPDKKETPLGVALFLYFVALVLIAVIAYNMYFSLVFINYEFTDVIQQPAENCSVFERLIYLYESLFIPMFGNTKACYVLSVALPVLAIDLIAASVNLSKHFRLKTDIEEINE